MAFGMSILISFALSKLIINLIVLVKYLTALLVITFSNQYLSAEFLSKILRSLFFMLVVIVGRTLTFGILAPLCLSAIRCGGVSCVVCSNVSGMLHYLHRHGSRKTITSVC